MDQEINLTNRADQHIFKEFEYKTSLPIVVAVAYTTYKIHGQNKNN